MLKRVQVLVLSSSVSVSLLWRSHPVVAEISICGPASLKFVPCSWTIHWYLHLWCCLFTSTSNRRSQITETKRFSLPQAPHPKCCVVDFFISVDENPTLLFMWAIHFGVILDLSLSHTSHPVREIHNIFRVWSLLITSFPRSWPNAPSSHVWITLRSS